MANDPTRLRTSAEIAKHANTNPVVVRRVLAPLRNAGMLESEKGHAGGWRLARPPKDITLADIYIALGEQLISNAESYETSTCSVEHTLQVQVSQVLENLEADFVDKISKIRLSDIGKDADHLQGRS